MLPSWKSPFLPQQWSTGEVFALKRERWADVPPTGSLPCLRQSKCHTWEARGSSKTQLDPQHCNRGSCVFLRGLGSPPGCRCAKGTIRQMEPRAHDPQKEVLSSACQTPKKKNKKNQLDLEVIEFIGICICRLIH